MSADSTTSELISRAGVHSPSGVRQRGIALAMLLWFLAALSLIAGGIVLQARVDIKLTQLHASRARAEAVGDGAIQLALNDLRMLEGDEAELAETGFTGTYNVGGYGVDIRLQPLAGLLDLNKASEDLLVLLFSTVEGLGDNEARVAAERVVEWRSSRAAAGDTPDAEEGESELRHGRFEAIEDLLFVPGVDRQIFEAVREVVYVSQGGQDGVDWASAPALILQAIGGGMSEEEAAKIAALRTQSESGMADAPAELDLAFQERSETTSYRVDAVVKIGEETFLRRRWVNSRRSGRDKLPWLFFRTEPVRAVASGADFKGENNAGR